MNLVFHISGEPEVYSVKLEAFIIQSFIHYVPCLSQICGQIKDGTFMTHNININLSFMPVFLVQNWFQGKASQEKIL